LHTWVEISEERLAQNFCAFAETVGPATEVLAVVKANAYGHGAELCSVALARAGARWLGVTSVAEGALVRQALDAAGFSHDSGNAPSILVMSGFLPPDVPTLLAHELTPVLWNTQQMDWLRGTSLGVHIEVDTGMGRQGAQPGSELNALLAELPGSGQQLGGIFTHFSNSEEADSPITHSQKTLFEQAIAQVKANGLHPGWVHAGNTSFVDNPSNSPELNEPWIARLATSIGARAMARTGLALYGYCLPIEGAAHALLRSKIRPVMTWKARVLAVRNLAPGDTVGYGAMFTAPTPMRVALLPVGYADGLRRELSSTTHRPGGWVIVPGSNGHPQPAPILGRVSMDLTVVDVTGLPIAAGDEVVLLGEGITAEDHAHLAHTIPYEILCNVGRR
jgi:alanine racemase